jgi:hypothetical protein
VCGGIYAVHIRACVGDFAINIAATLSAKIGIGSRALKFISLSSNIVQIANCKHFAIAIYPDSAVLRVKHFFCPLE